MNVLVVDDEIEVAKLVRVYLESAGLNIEVASSCAEAREVLKSQPVDLILCDYMMPDEKGDGLLLSLEKPIPFIFLTGHSDLSRERAIELGALELLDKPYRLADLAKLVVQLGSPAKNE